MNIILVTLGILDIQMIKLMEKYATGKIRKILSCFQWTGFSSEYRGRGPNDGQVINITRFSQKTPEPG